MTPLIFDCPRSGQPIDAGIQTDSRTIATARPVNLTVYCPHCRNTHEFPFKRGRLSGARVPEVLVVPGLADMVDPGSCSVPAHGPSERKSPAAARPY
jgi:hypothetical protein